MVSLARNPKKPPKNASFKEYIEYYLKIKGWSQSRLAECARLNQSQLNKIINARVNNVSVDVLVCLCLALQLTVPQSKDLMARAQRTFSPALPKHDAYQKLIALYIELREMVMCMHCVFGMHQSPQYLVMMFFISMQ